MDKKTKNKIIKEVYGWWEKELKKGHYPTTEDLVKQGIDFSELDCCERLIDTFKIESVPSKIEDFKELVKYVSVSIGEKKNG